MMDVNETSRREAIAWSLALQEAPNDGQVADGFLQWLSASEANQRAWGQVERMQAFAAEAPSQTGSPDAIDGARESTRAHSALRSEPPSASSGRHLRRTAYAAIAATLLLAAYLAVPDLLLRLDADHLTRAGETRSVVLPDGSSVHLGADSALAIEFTAERRDVELLQGVAHFDVQPDADRPFRVLHQGVSTRVVGTRFEVRQTRDGAAVAVEEGVVEVLTATPPDGGERDQTDAVKLEAGHRLRADAARAEIVIGDDIAPSKVARWRRGELIVDKWPVREVFDALARHYSGVLIVAPNSLSSDRMTGLYGLDDPVASIALVAQTQGLHMRQVSRWLIVVSAF